MTMNDPLPPAGAVVPRWRDPALSVADRVAALLAELTLAEKIGQLGSRWVGNDMAPADEAGTPPEGVVSTESMPVAPSRRCSRPPAGLRWRRPAGTVWAS
jgi:hypothetical protein